MSTAGNYRPAAHRAATPRLVNTIRQAARELGVGELTVRRRLKAGTLRGVQIGGTWRLPGPNYGRIVSLPEECTLHQVANSLDVSDLTVRRWVKQGEVPAHKKSRVWVIFRSDLENLLWGAGDRPSSQTS